MRQVFDKRISSGAGVGCLVACIETEHRAPHRGAVGSGREHRR